MELTWLTEDPLIPLVTGGALAIVFFILAFVSRERVMFLAAFGIVGLTALIMLVESVIVTDREVVSELVYDLAFIVQQNDVDGALKYVDQDMETTFKRVQREMPRYNFDTCRLMAAPEFEQVSEEPKTFKTEFTVSVRVAMGQSPDRIYGQRRVQLTWQQDENGQWKITDYAHWDPRRGLNP